MRSLPAEISSRLLINELPVNELRTSQICISRLLPNSLHTNHSLINKITTMLQLSPFQILLIRHQFTTNRGILFNLSNSRSTKTVEGDTI